MLRSERDRPALRRRPGAARYLHSKRAPGTVTCVLGRNGVGKSSLLRALIGEHPVCRGTIVWEAQDITTLRTVRARPTRHRLCAAGARDLSAAHRRGEPQDRLRAAQARRSQRSRRGVFAVPGARRHAAATRRRPFGRPAAATRHRPRAGDAARLLLLDEPTEGIQPSIIKDIGRAITLSARTSAKSPSCWSSSISTSPASSAIILP